MPGQTFAVPASLLWELEQCMCHDLYEQLQGKVRCNTLRTMQGVGFANLVEQAIVLLEERGAVPLQ